MKLIPLTKGKFAKVDDADFELLSKYKWYFVLKKPTARTGYAVHDFNKRHVSMHRFLLNPPKEMDVDHINRDGLDNRRSNIRICTRSFNMANIAARGRYKGVEKVKKYDKWFARIRLNGKRKYIGIFNTPEDAARAYNEVAKDFYGEFALLNTI